MKAFRDTWELGIHSYLAYLRDRLVVAQELLSETGSIFVQIGDENVHLVRCLMDEVFGASNFSAVIAFTKAAGGLQAARRTGTILDYIVWYGKDVENSKYRPLFEKRSGPIESGFTQIELPDGTRRSMTSAERSGEEPLDVDAKHYMTVLMTKPGPGSKYTVEFNQDFRFGPGTATVYIGAGPNATSFRAEPCTSAPPVGARARPSAHRR